MLAPDPLHGPVADGQVELAFEARRTEGWQLLAPGQFSTDGHEEHGYVLAGPRGRAVDSAATPCGP